MTAGTTQQAGGVLVRPATGNDLDAVVTIGRTTWPVIHEPIAGPEFVEMGLAKWWTADVVTRGIRAGRTLVAEVDGNVVGMASYGVQDDEFVLWKLYVLADHHGKGIGSRLMDAVVERAAELGHQAICLSYTDGNAYADRFYRAHGFAETHRETSGSGLPDSVWVRRELTEAELAAAHTRRDEDEEPGA